MHVPMHRRLFSEGTSSASPDRMKDRTVMLSSPRQDHAVEHEPTGRGSSADTAWAAITWAPPCRRKLARAVLLSP